MIKLNKDDYILIAREPNQNYLIDLSKIDSGDLTLQTNSDCDTNLYIIGNGQSFVGNWEFYVGKNSTLKVWGAFKNMDGFLEIETHLNKNSTYINKFGFYQNHGKKFRVEENINHFTSQTKSILKWQSYLDNDSTLHLQHLGKAEKTAQNISINHYDENTILDESSQVKTEPMLKVEIDSVSAKHGSSIGGISENELFYMQSRGLEKEMAKKEIALGKIMSLYKDSPEFYELVEKEFENED
ncbi:MAG: SufD family Fe-S cluster assembly protein [Pseudomonadales bacterium]|jgi:argininosuccinate synthase|nr:SufD family Fe-S cluster assembly protein [Pseudomonadales bacterium]